MISRAILILPRLFLGVIFLVAAYSKIAGGGFATHLSAFLSQVLPNATGSYSAFAQAVIVPHVAIVAPMVEFGEAFVGIAMILGVATRFASLVAILLLVNYMLAKGMALWAPASNDAADIIIAIVVGVGAAGRVCGIDAFLAKRFPRVLLW